MYAVSIDQHVAWLVYSSTEQHHVAQGTLQCTQSYCPYTELTYSPHLSACLQDRLNYDTQYISLTLTPVPRPLHIIVNTTK